MTVLQSAKPGATAAERAIITAAAAPSADPGATENGYNIQGADHLHLYVEFGASATACTVTPWFWNKITEKWHEDAANIQSFSLTQKRRQIDVFGEEKLFLVLDTLTGAGSVTIWAGYSYSDADVR